MKSPVLEGSGGRHPIDPIGAGLEDLRRIRRCPYRFVEAWCPNKFRKHKEGEKEERANSSKQIKEIPGDLLTEPLTTGRPLNMHAADLSATLD